MNPITRKVLLGSPGKEIYAEPVIIVDRNGNLTNGGTGGGSTGSGSSTVSGSVEVPSVGDPQDIVATSDDGTFTFISLFKRYLLQFTNLINLVTTVNNNIKKFLFDNTGSLLVSLPPDTVVEASGEILVAQRFGDIFQVAFTNKQRTPDFFTTSTTGTIAAGASSVTITNIGNQNAKVQNKDFSINLSMTWSVNGNDTLASIPYDATGTVLLITTLT